MVKGNQIIPNGHFHKDWQRRVRTWFAQPSRKLARRRVRNEKAARIAPRPLNQLKPAVHGQTIKYNSKIRAGRGFTLDELEAAELNPNYARTVGISVDHRRKNRSEEAFQRNVSRLKLYKSKLVIFPRKCHKKPKKGDATKEEIKAVQQNSNKLLVPLPTVSKPPKARSITEEERERSVAAVLRKALTDKKMAGKREKRAKDKAAGAAKASKKEDKEDKDGGAADE